MLRPAFSIAGATASGKSSLAVRLAKAVDGVIINGDSMQLYADLSILSARPSQAAMELVPHALYGILKAHEPNSVWNWMQCVDSILKSTTKVPIIVGGTGMYLKALEDGVIELPDLSLGVREKAQAYYDEVGEELFRKDLGLHDPISAEKIKSGDRQRLIRAWSVVSETGKSLDAWQKEPHWKPEGWCYTKILVTPPREQIYTACDGRLVEMIQEGALEEVKHLLSLSLDPTLPIMKAIGVAEFGAYLKGEFSLEDALHRAQQLTRNYAKRQLTWFRNQFSPDILITAPQVHAVEDILCQVDESLD